MKKQSEKEIALFLALVLGMGLIGTAAGAFFSFAGLGLVIWVIWRGRKL